jgi:hypothetical protein
VGPTGTTPPSARPGNVVTEDSPVIQQARAAAAAAEDRHPTRSSAERAADPYTSMAWQAFGMQQQDE